MYKKKYYVVFGNVKNGIHMQLKHIRIILETKKMELLMWMVFYHLLKIKKKNGLKMDGDKRYNIFKYLKCNEC